MLAYTPIFFNVHDRKDLPDTVGTELADRDAAHR